MRFVQLLYVAIALIMSAVIIGVSCSQTIGYQASMEIPFEEPLDEDSGKDFADDKEYTVQEYTVEVKENELNHSVGYLVSHINQVKEISTPPPKI